MQRDSHIVTLIKKYLPYIAILLMGVLVFLKPLGNGDELWNYNFAKNITQGNIPYRDFSIVQTPLSSYISACFLWLLGDGLFVFRIVAYLLFVGLAFLVFDLCKKATKSVGVAVCLTAFVMSSHFLYFIYNYNYLTAFVLLIIFELEQKKKYRFYIDVLIGLLVGITILIKQNTGAFIWLANIVICSRSLIQKSNCKWSNYFRMGASIVPILVYFIYLFFSGALYDFIDYAVIGISTFTHRYTLVDYFVDSSFFVPHLILIWALYILMSIKFIKNKLTDYQFSVMAFSIALASVSYPLSDVHHVLLVLFPLVPAFFSFYSYENIRRKEVLYSATLSYFIILLAVTFRMSFNVGFNYSELNNYQGLLIDQRVEKMIGQIDDYIIEKEKEGYTVRIADTNAAVIKIPLDTYEKNWDMLLVGNLGSNSVYELLQSDKPVLYLVRNTEIVYGLQDHYELISFIKDNYKKVDEIVGFDVYASK